MSAHESFGAARRAVPADLAEIERLCEAAAQLMAPERGGELFLGHDARTAPLSALVEASGAAVFVGTIDDVAVGYAVVRSVSLTDGRLIADCTDLFVEPGARQVGVGEALMNEVIEWGTAQGCIGVDATALPGDRHTKNFFESFGLVARAIRVHRRFT